MYSINQYLINRIAYDFERLFNKENTYYFFRKFDIVIK